MMVHKCLGLGWYIIDSTLLRLSEEDVALDMDEVVVEVEDELSDLDYESEDSESGGMAGN